MRIKFVLYLLKKIDLKLSNMKTTYILLFSMLFLNTILKAQSNEIGFSLFQLGTQQQNENGFNSSLINYQKSNYLRLSPAISFIHIQSNQIELSVQYGYSPISWKTSYQYKDEVNSNLKYYETKSNGSIHSLRLGIGKRNQWNQFVFSSMLYIPLSYSNQNRYRNKSTQYDDDNVLVRSTESNTKDPNSIGFGIFIAQAIRYPLCKKLSVGAELNLGLQQTLIYGNSRAQSISIENGVLIGNYDETTKVKSSSSYMNFLPALCLFYSFSSKK